MKQPAEALSTNSLIKLLERPDAERQLLLGDALPQALSFAQQLRALLSARSMTIPQLILAADLSRSYTYQLLRSERRPGRDVVLRIALALGLSMEKTQRLLTVSGNSVLYPKVRRDAALVFALSRGLSLAEAEELLARLPEKTLYNGG